MDSGLKIGIGKLVPIVPMHDIHCTESVIFGNTLCHQNYSWGRVHEFLNKEPLAVMHWRAKVVQILSILPKIT